MSIELSPKDRDALYQRVLLDFSAFDDLQMFIEAGDMEEAYKIGRRFADGFRLIADGGLGWEKGAAGPTTLELPPVELRRILTRMHDEALAEWEGKRPEREDIEKEWAEVTDVRDACAAVLEQVSKPQGTSPTDPGRA
jgi:hypothetical protein